MSDPLHEYDYDGDGRVSSRTSFLDQALVEEGYIYDYDGNLLVKNSSGGSTIYIGGIYEKAPNGVRRSTTSSTASASP